MKKILFAVLLSANSFSVHAQFIQNWATLINGINPSIESTSDYDGNMIKLSTDSGIYISGKTQVGQTTDAICSKLDLNGNVIWKVQFDYGLNLNDGTEAMVIDNNNNGSVN